MLLRRHENNIGPEELDLSDDNIEADDEDGTLVRGVKNSTTNGSGKFRSKSRVNGTSENKGDEKVDFGVHKILEKGKASLSRSKSELGEQHKKMISHWKFSKNEITEQNRKLLANLGSGIEKTSMVKKLLPGSFKKPSAKETTTSGSVPDHEGVQDLPLQSSRTTEVLQPNNNLETKEDLPQDLDGLMKNLGLHSSTTKRYDQPHRVVHQSEMSKSLYVQAGTSESYDLALEKHLENDYGEFEFIDEGGTLTRSLKTNGEAVNTEEHRKSMFSFSEEVFDELEKAGTLQRPSSQKDCVNNSSSTTKEPPETYETYGAWRQKRNQQQHQSSYVSQYYHHHHHQQQQQNNNNSVTNNTSAKLSALIADQTLLLRHHKRRKKLEEQQQQQQHQQKSYAIQDFEESDHMQQSLLALQQQLENATKKLEGSSSSHGDTSVAPLRRCSSLSQTYQEDQDFDLQAPAKVNGTSPLSSSPWLSSNSTNCRYLYRGKFQPTTPSHSNSMNNNSNHVKKNGSNESRAAAGPWQLRSNLSSFARRRRGSSTSLHTFSDNEDDSITSMDYHQTNGYHSHKKRNSKPDADSVSLTGGTEPSHR